MQSSHPPPRPRHTAAEFVCPLPASARSATGSIWAGPGTPVTDTVRPNHRGPAGSRTELAGRTGHRVVRISAEGPPDVRRNDLGRRHRQPDLHRTVVNQPFKIRLSQLDRADQHDPDVDHRVLGEHAALLGNGPQIAGNPLLTRTVRSTNRAAIMSRSYVWVASRSRTSGVK